MRNYFLKISNHVFSRLTLNSILVLMFFLYLWLVIDTRLVYHGGGFLEGFPAFYLGLDFFREFISTPGGMIEYASAFLFQFFYYSWAGAFVLTGLVMLIFLFGNIILKTAKLESFSVVCYVPAILILILCGQYVNHLISIVSLLSILIFQCLYFFVSKKKFIVHIALYVLLSAILCYIAGAIYLFFVLACVLYEFLVCRRRRIGAILLLAGLVIPYLWATLFFDLRPTIAYCYPFPFPFRTVHGVQAKSTAITFVFYLYIPVVFILSKVKHLFANKYFLIPSKARQVRTTVSVMLFLLTCSAALFYDKDTKAILAYDYYASCRQWAKALDIASGSESSNDGIYLINRALYHTGKLNNEMFNYHQHKDALFMKSKVRRTRWLRNWRRSAIYLDLGYLNYSVNLYTECLEVFGEYPFVLKQLILTYLARGNIETAKTFLYRLRKTLFHSGWANKYLSLLESDPELLTVEKIQQLRTLNPKMDSYLFIGGRENDFMVLFDKNKKNKMAFEYMMSQLLLEKKLQVLALNMYRLDDFEYKEIPVYYQEALLIGASLSGEKPDMANRQISKETIGRFNKFLAIYRRFSSNQNKAYNALVSDFGNSYFFYFVFGVSGVGR